MSKKLDILNIQGTSVGEYVIEDAQMELERGEQAVHDVVVAYLAGKRAGTASTKTRAEVRGGGVKPFKQKGTGRARSGSIRNPIWTGGGVIFGPKYRSYAKKINKKVRTLALKRAFSEKLCNVTLLDNLAIEDHKTKSVQNILSTLKLEGKIMIVVNDYDEKILRATGNIQNLILIKADSVNVYQILKYKKLLITKDAMDILIQRVG